MYYASGRWSWQWQTYSTAAVRWVMFGLPVIVAWRLSRACGLYLRIERPVLVAVLTQLMLTLLMLKFAFDESILFFRW